MIWNTDMVQMPEPADGEDFGPVALVGFYLCDDADQRTVMVCRLAWFEEKEKPSPFDGSGGGTVRALALQCCVTGARVGAHLVPYCFIAGEQFDLPDPADF